MAKLCLFAGWVVLAFVVFATLAPIYDRPAIAPPHVEHFAAFFMLGLLFVLAYPNRIILVLLIVVGSALTLETLQLLTPDRHGRLIDASIKVAGGLSGVALLVLARATAIQTKAKIASLGLRNASVSIQRPLAHEIGTRLPRILPCKARVR